MYIKLYKNLFILALVFVVPLMVSGQGDTAFINAREPVQDTTLLDTMVIDVPAQPSSQKRTIIEAQVKYSAKDSIVLSRDKSRVFLYRDAEVTYGEINLKADFIEYDQENNQVFATYLVDTMGNETGMPVFTEGGTPYDARTIRYNFKTKKGYIEDVFTKDQQGYLHSNVTKLMPDKTINLKAGKYTTCEDPDHPHFYLAMSKAKAIPNDKIVSGYSYLVLADMPLYFLFLPFGYFPNQKQQSSGILVPSYGEEKNRGFFLKNGGYYFGINDNMDLSLIGEIYSKGTWGAAVKYRYLKRYKFSSNLAFNYYRNVEGEKGLADYSESTSYKLMWTHAQDAKANPTSKFSASVNLSSSSYEKLHSNSVNDYTTNTKSSSINYSKNWPGTPFRLNASFRHSQNSKTEKVSVSLPTMTLNMDRQYPFRGLAKSGKKRWYEDIEVSYSSKFDNKVTTYDSILFTSNTLDEFDYGFKHDIPIRTNFKLFNLINISPQVKYTGILNHETITKEEDERYRITEYGDIYWYAPKDTIPKIGYSHLVEPSISVGAAPKVFFTYQFTPKDFKIEAIRHVMTPSASFSFRPDLGDMVDKYYDDYKPTGSTEEEYYIYGTGIYGFPASPGKSGSVSLGLANNLEMKVRTPKDTVNDTKKVSLLESFNFSTSYNVFAEEFNWSTIRLSGRTSLFDKKLGINFSANWDPYTLDEDGNRVSEFVWNDVWDETGLLRFTGLNLSANWRIGSKKAEGQDDDMIAQQEAMQQNQFDDPLNRYYDEMAASNYVDFDVPWSVSIRYSFNYTKSGWEEPVKRQTLGVQGDLSLTPKWKISFNTNYDFDAGKLAATSVNIHRDLHCWEMTFGWIPVGARQSYNFRINVKSSILQDLQFTKKKTWQDY